MLVFIADSSHTNINANTPLISIDGKYGQFIHGLLNNNPQTCSIGRSPWEGNSRN